MSGLQPRSDVSKRLPGSVRRRGGVIRDILLARVPMVLVADIYASAAFAGGLVLVVSRRVGLSPMAAALLGGAACFILRVASVTYGWQLPKIAHW
jgi:uncharacterized membrane protein YeiH